MRPLQLTALIAMAAVGATTSGADPAGQAERVFVGYAYDSEDGALVYREVHRIDFPLEERGDWRQPGAGQG